ncbi:MAG: hypothetical protein AAB225_01305 [Acidobacteriota bacterium]
MPSNEDRRRFLKRSLQLSAGLAAGVTFEHRPLIAKMMGQTAPAPEPRRGALATGRIGNLKVTRLICGGNLFSGFAHSGDLLYVSRLLRHYFSEDKILETLQISEESGINTAILRTDDQIIKVLKRYRKERGGRIQWIAQTYPKAGALTDNIQMAIDNGAVGAFIMGGNAETFHKEGRTELMGEVIAFMKRNGLAAGVGSHLLAIPTAVEALRAEPDFYFKTLNNVGYESERPEEIAAYMKALKKPWVAFKVLGAGRMKPREGLDLAFRAGADFVNVGMYDFQVKEDVALVSEVTAAHARRERPWA